VRDNIEKIASLVKAEGASIAIPSKQAIISSSLESKIVNNVMEIHGMVKALTAGYGGAGSPTANTGGGVLQSEALDDGRPKDKGFKYISCDDCGKEQIYSKYQVKCRECGTSFAMEKLHKLFLGAIAT
jgi:ribosomal protein S27E